MGRAASRDDNSLRWGMRPHLKSGDIRSGGAVEGRLPEALHQRQKTATLREGGPEGVPLSVAAHLACYHGHGEDQLAPVR